MSFRAFFSQISKIRRVSLVRSNYPCFPCVIPLKRLQDTKPSQRWSARTQVRETPKFYQGLGLSFRFLPLFRVPPRGIRWDFVRRVWFLRHFSSRALQDFIQDFWKTSRIFAKNTNGFLGWYLRENWGNLCENFLAFLVFFATKNTEKSFGEKVAKSPVEASRSF